MVLLFLQVIVALSVRGRDHIPYRSSKLTHVLKDCLGGNCKTLMLACIWGEASQLEETTSTCRSAPSNHQLQDHFGVSVNTINFTAATAVACMHLLTTAAK